MAPSLEFQRRFAELTKAQQRRYIIRREQAFNAIATRKTQYKVRVQSFVDRVNKDLSIGVAARVRLAGQLLRDKVVLNISRPVTKLPNQKRSDGSKYTWVDPASRSRPGEFPKAETSALRTRGTFYKFVRGSAQNKRPRALVGTTFGYGVILETRMNRSFLRRTLREERDLLTKIITRGDSGLNEPGVFTL